ncbi:MAG: hypothetical protein KatS3mg131_0785 [Candidatus Tectimicrobiota bacterium]|nr:MAG: hypothetical protein KatS3mg131_0785 [Candidatus Tectomicrobia bacterium]
MAQREEEEQQSRGFTVLDRRLFTPEGERRRPIEPTEPPKATPRQEAPRAEEATRRRPQEAEAMELPPANFINFVAMLANNALMFLGQIPDPVTQQRHRDLAQAKHTIDTLLMLRDKTRGNLTAQEEQVLQEVLAQLQMAYVSIRRQVG